MQESELPKRCADALKEVGDARKAHPELSQIQISENHRLHRMVTARDVIGTVIATSVFEQHDCSVFAEGEGLPALELEELEKLKDHFIGSISFEASVLLRNLEKSKLIVVHDPFPDPNGSQHPNHVRIICKKNTSNTQPLIEGAVFHPRTS